MNTVERVLLELRASQVETGVLFAKCYRGVFRHPCASNRVSQDAARWDRCLKANGTPGVPDYVSRYFEILDECNADGIRMLSGFGGGERYHTGHATGVKLVSDGDPVLHAQRGKDGVWRC